MSYFPITRIQSADSSSIDAAGNWRVSLSYTVFDNKMLHDAGPLFWDHEMTAMDGTSMVHHPENAEHLMSVAASAGQYIISQSKMRANYQPSKCQKIMMTGRIAPETNVFKALGYFTGQKVAPYNISDGLYFSSQDGYMAVNRAKEGSIYTANQVDWNIDPMDGSGPSGITLDTSTAQVFVIDFIWLGYGRIRFGFEIDGQIHYCHKIENGNVNHHPFLSSPNLPVRYEIRSLGGAGSMSHVCASVSSESGTNPNGHMTATRTTTHVDANTVGTDYAVIGLKFKDGYEDVTIIPDFISMLATTADNFSWCLSYNPTVAGAFAYNIIDNSALQVAYGATANTISNLGEVVAMGFGSGSNVTSSDLRSAILLGSNIDGISDTLVLSVRPLTANLDIFGAITWREL